jgi:hypothetical protein
MLVVIKGYEKAEPAWLIAQEHVDMRAQMWKLGYVLAKGAAHLNKLIEDLNHGNHTD